MTRSLKIVAAALSLAAAAATAQEVEINFAHVDPADWTTSKKGAAALAFKEVVEAESAGRIAVNLFDSGQLGGETDLVQSVQDGTIQMTMISGPFSQLCPEADVLNIPYIFPSASVAWSVLDGEFGDRLAQHCLEKTGLRTLAYGETGFRNFTNSQRPIRTPEDVAGLKLRVMTVPLFVEMVEALGGEPTPIAWPEVPTALATGVVDGQENPVSVIAGNRFYEFQDYLTLDQHVYGTDFILIGDDFYQSLSPADQAIIQNAAVVAGNMGRSIQQLNSAQGVQTLIENGMEVYKPTPEEIQAFADAAQPPVKAYLADQLGEEWIAAIEEAVAQATGETAAN